METKFILLKRHGQELLIHVDQIASIEPNADGTAIIFMVGGSGGPVDSSFEAVKSALFKFTTLVDHPPE